MLTRHLSVEVVGDGATETRKKHAGIAALATAGGTAAGW
jgi:hypothetical protein